MENEAEKLPPLPTSLSLINKRKALFRQEHLIGRKKEWKSMRVVGTPDF